MEANATTNSYSAVPATGFSEKLIVNHSRLMKAPESSRKKANNFNQLESCSFFSQSYDLFTLIIIMRPMASLTSC
ncbi:hypothetical protein [uncultured Methylophaga sp.]|uniref:hypothetical protein n=1 Tax=uncultured Methylophaga sp. TaxID=285271 RepID=UPI002634F593|nr:hypothetical protein [uncultured Methylophaga sp.]